MKVQLLHLELYTRESVVLIDFSEVVTFIHGPIGKGKSTVARLVDYCLGGSIERTPALQNEFVSSILSVILGVHTCRIERGAEDTQSVRVSWTGPDESAGSVNAPLSPQSSSLIDGEEVFNLSDLIFYFCGVSPIKVRKQSRDPESPLIRLSFRDLWWYCYLEQTHLDSTFFRLEDPFRGRKSQDAMRFFTGLHSERLSQIEEDLIRARDEQRSKRDTVEQIRAFMNRFSFESETDLEIQLETVVSELKQAEARLKGLEADRTATTHPSDELRQKLRSMSQNIELLRNAIADSEAAIHEQKALKAEFITAKTKSERNTLATNILEGVEFDRCPECGSDISNRIYDAQFCRLCQSPTVSEVMPESLNLEVLRRDLNERIDQINDSLDRRSRELDKQIKQLDKESSQKAELDRQLQEELRRYDSAFVESIRAEEREVATLKERFSSLQRLRLMPEAINKLEEEAGSLQGRIDNLRHLLNEERERLQGADANIDEIAAEFKRIMLDISFPGVWPEDEVNVDPRNWKPTVRHWDPDQNQVQEWSFWETGSGGKKTLFNVCYALAIHSIAIKRGMPVPSVLIIDSPTKNISDEENPELIESLYEEIYRLARTANGNHTQFLLIDSDLVKPRQKLLGFSELRMAGDPDAPSLIPYYFGP